MPLTTAEQKALEDLILDDDTLKTLRGAFDPATNAFRDAVLTRTLAVRTAIETRRLAIPAKAQAENAALLAQLAILDSLLAKFA